MSEVANDLSGAPGSAPSSDPTSDTREIELEVLRRYGHDVSKFTEAAPAPGGTPRPGTNIAGDAQAIVDLDAPPDTTAEELATLRRYGFDEEAIARLLKATNRTEPTSAAPEPEDTRTDAQREHDQNHLMDREFSPADYPARDMALAYREAGMIQQASPEAFQEWSAFLAAGAVPPNMGPGLVGQWLQDAHAYKAMSDGERTLWAAEQRGQAFIAAGATQEALSERARQRDVFVRHMLKSGQARVIDALNRSGAMKSAFTFNTMANLGARIEAYTKDYPADELGKSTSAPKYPGRDRL